VDMRLSNVGDAQPIGACRARVYPDVGVWVDDDRVARMLVCDEVTRLRQIFVVESPEDHAPRRREITLLWTALIVSVQVENTIIAQYTTT